MLRNFNTMHGSKNIKFETYTNKRDNARINVTLRRVHVTVVAVEKQYVLHILSVCLLP